MWSRIKAWFGDSETIFWARLQVLGGAVAAAAMGLLSDPGVHAAIQAAVDPAYVPYYLIAFGLLTEMLRRRRATDL